MVKACRTNTDTRFRAERFKSSPAVGVLWLMFIASLAFFFTGMPRYVDDFWYAENIRP